MPVAPFATGFTVNIGVDHNDLVRQRFDELRDHEFFIEKDSVLAQLLPAATNYLQWNVNASGHLTIPGEEFYTATVGLARVIPSSLLADENPLVTGIDLNRLAFIAATAFAGGLSAEPSNGKQRWFDRVKAFVATLHDTSDYEVGYADRYDHEDGRLRGETKILRGLSFEDLADDRGFLGGLALLSSFVGPCFTRATRDRESGMLAQTVSTLRHTLADSSALIKAKLSRSEDAGTRTSMCEWLLSSEWPIIFDFDSQTRRVATRCKEISDRVKWTQGDEERAQVLGSRFRDVLRGGGYPQISLRLAHVSQSTSFSQYARLLAQVEGSLHIGNVEGLASVESLLLEESAYLDSEAVKGKVGGSSPMTLHETVTSLVQRHALRASMAKQPGKHDGDTSGTSAGKDPAELQAAQEAVLSQSFLEHAKAITAAVSDASDPDRFLKGCYIALHRQHIRDHPNATHQLIRASLHSGRLHSAQLHPVFEILKELRPHLHTFYSRCLAFGSEMGTGDGSSTELRRWKVAPYIMACIQKWNPTKPSENCFSDVDFINDIAHSTAAAEAQAVLPTVAKGEQLLSMENIALLKETCTKFCEMLSMDGTGQQPWHKPLSQINTLVRQSITLTDESVRK